MIHVLPVKDHPLALAGSRARPETSGGPPAVSGVYLHVGPLPVLEGTAT